MSKEINLVPLRRRRQLIRRFYELELRRFVMSLLLATLLVTVSGVVAVVGLQVMAGVIGGAAREELDTAVIDYRAETRLILEQNAEIVEMQRHHEQRLEWSGWLPDVFASLPGGVVISQLSGAREGRELQVVGHAPARSAVIVLEDKLKTLPWVKTIEAPHSNLLERLSPEFIFKIRL